MTEQEKIDFKIELLRNIEECMTFNWGSVDYTLNKIKLQEMIDKYYEQKRELNNNENKN